MPPYLKLGAALGALLSFHGAPVMAQAAGGETLTLERVSVSYTHLTLPTTERV